MITPARFTIVTLSASCSVFQTGCRGLPDEAPYAIELTNELAPASVQILLDGVEICTSPDRSVTAEFTGRPFTDENPQGPGTFTVLVEAPWGWEEIASSVRPPMQDYHEYQAKRGRPTTLYIHILLDGYQIGHLYVDNRDGEEVVLELGQATYVILANSATEAQFGAVGGVTFLMPRDESEAEVKLNGRRAGTIAVTPDIAGSPYQPLYLIDTSGRRSYRLQHLRYGGISVFLPPQPSTLRDRHIHRIAVNPPDRFFFLAEGPARLSVPLAETVHALELTDMLQR